MKLKLMTTNLRYGTANDGEYIWENRRPVMMDMLREYNPDIFGVQEGLRFQLDEIIEALPGYACFGEGRDELDKGEHVAIFYNVRRLYCIEGSSFWLSETPEVPGSRSWESGHSRSVTWGRFQQKPTGAPFYFYNTHYGKPNRDVYVRVLRRGEGLELGRKRDGKWQYEPIPVDMD